MASGGEGGQTVLATVQEVLMVHSGNNNRAPNVYGSITVNGTHQLIVFRKTRDEAVNVPENRAIPLQSTQVRTKPDSLFEVNAKLWDANQEGAPDHQIVDGSVPFHPTTNGPESHTIAAPDGGKVRVDITWSA